MSEPLAAHPNNAAAGAVMGPEIGDVLASIRRLIAQEDAGPDFAQPVRRLDASGKARSALPLGPKAEKLRSVIERELSAIDLADDRLVLGGDARMSPDDLAQDELTLSLQDEIADTPMDAFAGDRIADAEVDELSFDELAYQQARKAGLGRAEGPAAQITTIPPHMGPTPAPMTNAQETDMMLAEKLTRADLHKEAAIHHDGAGFDLFAADTSEDEDQMAGGNALRNLVRDVIRQELQGEMGDRISRNLRRAIRQEVTAAIESGLKIA